MNGSESHFKPLVAGTFTFFMFISVLIDRARSQKFLEKVQGTTYVHLFKNVDINVNVDEVLINFQIIINCWILYLFKKLNKSSNDPLIGKSILMAKLPDLLQKKFTALLTAISINLIGKIESI